jgi:hypothetical protein
MWEDSERLQEDMKQVLSVEEGISFVDSLCVTKAG